MNLIRYYEKEGYMFIWDKSMLSVPDMNDDFPGESLTRIESQAVTGKEFDKVVMLLDDTFYYDEKRYLRNRDSGENAARIMNLFHGLSRAKHSIALVIEDNIDLMSTIYSVLQTQAP